jgi:hypothetical protein
MKEVLIDYVTNPSPTPTSSNPNPNRSHNSNPNRINKKESTLGNR